jgi:hypothetical protein
MHSLTKTTAAILTLGLLAGACASGPDDEAMRTTATPVPAKNTSTEVIAGERMNGASIHRHLVGYELTARNIDTDTINVVWLTPDKRVKWVKGDRITFGTWRITGNQLCFRYDDPGKGETCSEVYRQGPKRYVSVRDGKPVSRITIGK